jgi:2,3-bisphosphoglycerate-dependent phosphoglycerate mutase
MGKLAIVRHGQSVWNLENRFTGWVDVDLSDTGIQEARSAGLRLKGTSFDALFTSELKRAKETARLALESMGVASLPTRSNEALNERHYGDLQGLNKDETRAKYGAEQVHEWRRSYHTRPPGGENLADTVARVLPYFDKEIMPLLQANKNVLVVAHGNSLRALIKQLEGLSEDDIIGVEIPTGTPIVYDIDTSGRVLSKTVLGEG